MHTRKKRVGTFIQDQSYYTLQCLLHWKKQTEEDVRNGKEKLYPYAIFRWDGNTLY